MIIELTKAEREVYELVPGGLEWASTNDIFDQVSYTRTTVLRALHKLHNFHMIHRKIGNPYMWTRR
jgi:predicted transcriptional regulator